MFWVIESIVYAAPAAPAATWPTTCIAPLHPCSTHPPTVDQKLVAAGRAESSAVGLPFCWFRWILVLIH